jgi:AcrR family transcriptional regulator
MAIRKVSKETSRDKLIRAAETLMRDSGYAAVTSRQVAAKAGLKPQLVHYYFKTMDDLFLEVFRELATDRIERQKAILTSKSPLKDLWKLAVDARGALLNEFVALANHRKVIKDEIADYGDRFRRGQIEIMAHILASKGNGAITWTPTFAAFLLNSLARGLAVERGLGMSVGHAEALTTIKHFIDQFE